MSKIKFLIITIILLTACKKEDTNPPSSSDSQEVDLRLKEVHVNGILERSYSYNNENKVESNNYYNEVGDTTLIFLYYYSGDTITREWHNSNNEVSIRYTYYPISNNIFRRDRQNFTGSMNFSYNLYHFDGNSCGYNLLESYDTNDSLTSLSVAEYSEITCNVFFSRQDGLGQEVGTFEYIRDNKNSYINSARNIILQPNPVGNTIKLTRTDEFGEIDQEGSYESIYIYNSNSYPTNEIRTYANGEVTDIDYVYY